MRDPLLPLTDRPDDDLGVVVCERLVLDCCPLCGNDAALVFDWVCPDDGTDEVEVRGGSAGAGVVVFAADEDVG